MCEVVTVRYFHKVKKTTNLSMIRRDLGSFSLFSSVVLLTVKTLLKVDQTSSRPKLNTRHFHVWLSLLLSSRPQRMHDAKNTSFDTPSSLGL